MIKEKCEEDTCWCQNKTTQKCEHDTCLWEVKRVFSVSAVSDNTLLTECDVECLKCGARKYVVSSGNIIEDGEDIA